MNKKLPIITALLLRLATSAFAQQTPTVEAIEQIIADCFTQHSHHVQQARQAVARGERSDRDLLGVPNNESTRLSALTADFHANCIKDTLQTRYANSGKAVVAIFEAELRNGVLTDFGGRTYIGVGDFSHRDGIEKTDFYLDPTVHLFDSSVGSCDVVTNIADNGERYSRDFLHTGKLSSIRERYFDTRGLERRQLER